MEVLIAIAFIAALTVLALLVGFGALRVFGVPQRSALESCCFALAFGLGIIAYWMFLDGLLGLDAPWAGGAFLAAALGRYGWEEARRNVTFLARSASSLRGTHLTLALLLLPLPALAFITALAPPVANDADSLTYHLAIPKLYLAKHHLFYVPWSDHSNFPFTMEMLYMIGLRLNPIAAKLPHFVTYLLALATIVLMGNTFFSLEAGLAGALVFASVPMVLHEATTAYVDIALAAFTLLAFYCLIQWLTHHATRSADDHSPLTAHHYLPVCGAFCGLAMGVKYTGVLVFAICTGWVLFIVTRSRMSAIKTTRTPLVPSEVEGNPTGPERPVLSVAEGSRGEPRTLVLALALALTIASPWYVKNVVNTGNPLYPFFYEVFGGRNWTREMAQQYKNHQREFGYARTPSNLLASPWRASMWPWNYMVERPGYLSWCYETAPLPPTMGMIGPTLLALVLPAFLFRRRDSSREAWRVLVGSSLAFFLVWFVLEQYNRYLFPCVGLLSVVAGFTAAELMQRNSATRIVALTALVTSLGIAGALLVRFHTLSTIRYTLGQLSSSRYLYGFEIYQACEYLNESTPPNAKVMLLGEERGFYLDREYLWGNPGHHTLPELPYKHLKTAADWCRAAKTLKVTHLLVNRKYMGAGGNWVEEGVASGLLLEKFNVGGIAVYQLK